MFYNLSTGAPFRIREYLAKVSPLGEPFPHDFTYSYDPNTKILIVKAGVHIYTIGNVGRKKNSIK